MKWITEREWDYLQNEVDFWRKRADSERLRADRLQDQLLLERGAIPTSDGGRDEYQAERDRLDAEVAEQRQQLAELAQDQIEELDSGLDPEEVAKVIRQALQ